MKNSITIILLSAWFAILPTMRASTQDCRALIEKAPVIYPIKAREAGVQGSVTALIIIDAQGRVVNVTTDRESNPLLAEATQQSLRQWRFEVADNQVKEKYQMAMITLQYRLKDMKKSSVYLAGH